ncbi:MAG: DUF3892 domain-containing protein [bacterium]|nr:DUF3892 domain-containing protein [bacterium]
MAKWADYLISKDRYDKDRNHIVQVRRHNNNGDSVGISETVSRVNVISSLEKGFTYVTIYKENGKWNKGEDVRIISVNGKKYIRTDANKKEADNLGELPEF